MTAVTVAPVATEAARETEPEIARPAGNAHGNEPAKTAGQIVGISLGISVGKSPQPIPPATTCRKMPTEMPTEKSVGKSGNAHGKISGHFGSKSVGISGNAHEFTSARTEWFRYEMDFRDRKKGGHQVLIRRRLKWSAIRHAPTIASCHCADLTERMVSSIKDDGKFTPAAIAALQNGGISHEIIKKLLERIGKGNGKRAAELTEYERSILARIESGLAAGDGRRNDRAGGERRRLDLPRADVPCTHDGEFAEVPNVHCSGAR